jgi:opacity protein-like surface antigen
MNKWILALLFFAVSTLTWSQQEFNAGLTAGLNISQIEGDGFAGYNKAGAALGIFANTFFMDELALQVEINYSSKGSQRKTTIEDPRYFRIELHYVEIPVLLRYFFPVGISAEAGLSGGYLFNSSERDEVSEIEIRTPFNKTEFAFIAGASWHMTQNLAFISRFSYSILPVRQHAGGGTFRWNRGQNNNVLTFGVQYQF